MLSLKLIIFLFIIKCLKTIITINCIDGQFGKECNISSSEFNTRLNIFNPKCQLCDSCTKSLIDYQDEIHRDIIYANDKIKKSKLSATIRMKLNDLEQTFNEHSIGFKNSQEMFNRSLKIVNNYNDYLKLNNNPENNSINIIIDRIELEFIKLKEDLEITSKSLNYVNDNFELIHLNSYNLNSIFRKKLNFINNITKELELTINNNYDEYLAFEINNGKLLSESEKLINNQRIIGKQLNNTKQELYDKLDKIKNLTEKLKVSNSNNQINIPQYVSENVSSYFPLLSIDENYRINCTYFDDNSNKVKCDNEFLSKLEERVSDELNRNSESNLTSFDYYIRQSIESLKNKIDYSRTMLNHLKLGCQFDSNLNKFEQIKQFKIKKLFS